MSFNKIFKKQKEKGLAETQKAKQRIVDIINAYGKINKEMEVNVFELCDVLVTMIDGNNRQMAAIIRGRGQVIKELEKEIEKRDKRIEELINQVNEYERRNKSKKDRK